jgi:hypothetical protein
MVKLFSTVSTEEIIIYHQQRPQRRCVSANGCDGSKGIAGIVINSTDSYALVQSVLSVNKIRINAA